MFVRHADIDECQDGQNGLCDVNAVCTNKLGGRECKCKEGFIGSGRKCRVC